VLEGALKTSPGFWEIVARACQCLHADCRGGLNPETASFDCKEAWRATQTSFAADMTRAERHGVTAPSHDENDGRFGAGGCRDHICEPTFDSVLRRTF